MRMRVEPSAWAVARAAFVAAVAAAAVACLLGQFSPTAAIAG